MQFEKDILATFLTSYYRLDLVSTQF